MDRAPEPEADDEVGAVLGWLNFHRDALASKCEGMTAEQLVAASAPPSTLTLLGLVRHLTEIERDHLVKDLGGENRGTVYLTDNDPEADIEDLDVAMVNDSMTRWRQERDAADAAIARHNGHADIIRERIDGSRGE